MAITACVPSKSRPGGEGHVVVAKGGGDLEEGDAVGRHLLKVRRDDEVAVNVPDQLDLRDPLNVLDLRDDQVLHQRLDLDEWPVRHHAELDHGKGVRVETAHGGVIHGGREVHAIEGILNKRFGCGHIRAVLECGKDRRVAFGGRGLNGLQPIGARDSPLNRVRDIADHGLGVGGRIRCKYGDQGELDLREQFHLHRAIGNHAGDQDKNDRQKGHGRAAQGECGKEGHLAAPAVLSSAAEGRLCRVIRLGDTKEGWQNFVKFLPIF